MNLDPDDRYFGIDRSRNGTGFLELLICIEARRPNSQSSIIIIIMHYENESDGIDASRPEHIQSRDQTR